MNGVDYFYFQFLFLYYFIMMTTFYYCPTCGNVMLKLAGYSVSPSCCGSQMQKLEPGTTDGKTEYHLPVVEPFGDNLYRISVGKEFHPMLPEHSILFVYILTEKGAIIRKFKSGDVPQFSLRTHSPIEAVYAYCNLHGLWMTLVE